MFGADTPLVMDALQIAAVAAAVSGGAVWFLLRRKKSSSEIDTSNGGAAMELEDRVRVLERIATDRSIDLADEIEALRETGQSEKDEACKAG